MVCSRGMALEARDATSRLFFIAALLVPSCKGSLQDQPTDLTILSYNIRFGAALDRKNNWENRRKLALNVFRRYRPDAVGMQELLDFQREDILEAFPGYEAIGPPAGQTTGHAEESWILYDKARLTLLDSGYFWLSKRPEEPGSLSWESKFPRVCTWARFRADNGRKFYQFNSHFDHMSPAARLEGAKLVQERINGREHRDPVILTGDLNAGENSPPIQYLKSMQDTFRIIHPTRNDAGTFNAFDGRTGGRKLDYILVTLGFDVVDAGILRDDWDGRFPSDHYPVAAWLRF